MSSDFGGTLLLMFPRWEEFFSGETYPEGAPKTSGASWSPLPARSAVFPVEMRGVKTSPQTPLYSSLIKRPRKHTTDLLLTGYYNRARGNPLFLVGGSNL